MSVTRHESARSVHHGQGSHSSVIPPPSHWGCRQMAPLKGPASSWNTPAVSPPTFTPSLNPVRIKIILLFLFETTYYCNGSTLSSNSKGWSEVIRQLSAVADLGGAKGGPPAPPPPEHTNSFDFMQFSGKFGKIICWRPPGELAPPGEILDPPLFGICFWPPLEDTVYSWV